MSEEIIPPDEEETDHCKYPKEQVQAFIDRRIAVLRVDRFKASVALHTATGQAFIAKCNLVDIDLELAALHSIDLSQPETAVKSQ